jgi:hypothetical protein
LNSSSGGIFNGIHSLQEVSTLIFFCRGFRFKFFCERSLLSCLHIKKLLFHFSSTGNLRFRLRCILWLKRLQLEASVCWDLRQSTFASSDFSPNFFSFQLILSCVFSSGGLFTRYPFYGASYLRFSSGDFALA